MYLDELTDENFLLLVTLKYKDKLSKPTATPTSSSFFKAISNRFCLL